MAHQNPCRLSYQNLYRCVFLTTSGSHGPPQFLCNAQAGWVYEDWEARSAESINFDEHTYGLSHLPVDLVKWRDVYYAGVQQTGYR